MLFTLLSSDLENFLLLWRGFIISSGTQFWERFFLILVLMKCRALRLSRYVAGENVGAFLHDDISLVCTEV